MAGKQLTVMVALTALLAGTALVVLDKETSQRTADAAEDMRSGKVAPALAENVNTVTQVKLSDIEHASTITQSGDNRWHVEELDGYPADVKKLRAMLYRLAASEYKAKKTADPALLSRLSVDDENAVRIQAYTADTENPVADVLTGRYDPTFKGTYMRLPGEDQSWMISEDITYSAQPLTWVEKVVANVPRARVWQVELNHKGKPTVLINRERAAGDFTLEGIPEGKEVSAHYDIYTIAMAAENMKLRNVLHSDDLPGKVQTVAYYRTLDGLEVQIDIAPETIGGMHWATVAARYVPELVREDEASKKLAIPEDDVKAEIESINAITSGWMYQLDDYAYRLMTKTMDDLTRARSSTEDASQE